MERGGWVMWPLLVLSIVSIALILERSWFWFRNRQPINNGSALKMAHALREGKMWNAAALADKDQTIYGRVVKGIITLGCSESVGLEVIENERRRIERFMVVLSTIITASPLLGILGTVSGIIRSFHFLSGTDVVTDPRLVSAGIAEALLTTAFGLIVALVTLFPYMVFRAQVDRCLGRLEAIVAAAEAGRCEE